MATIKMRNEHTGQFKKVPIGFSWTTLFFGFFPALFRSDWKNFFILFFLGPLTLGVLYIVYCFKYNKIYINDLVEQGYKAIMTKDEAAFTSTRIGIHLPVYDEERMSSHGQSAEKKVNWPAIAITGIALSVAFGVILHKSNEDNLSTIAKIFDSQIKSNPKLPPEPINPRAYNLVKNVLIDDFMASVEGGESTLKNLHPEIIPKTVQSQTLSNEYHANEFIADEKYKNKKIIVSGNVLEIRKDLSDNVIIDLPGKQPHMDVSAELKESAKTFAGKISKGTSVDFACTVSGMTIGSIMLENCEPAHWYAERKSENVVKKLNAWLSEGAGKKPKPTEHPEVLAAMYFLGANLPKDHACIKEVAYLNCANSLNNSTDFVKMLESTVTTIPQTWLDWLNLSILLKPEQAS